MLIFVKAKIVFSYLSQGYLSFSFLSFVETAFSDPFQSLQKKLFFFLGSKRTLKIITK